MKRILIIFLFSSVLLIVVFTSCGTKLRLPEECAQEELFAGQKWKLRLLTTLYKPYRQYKPYVKKSITAFRIEYPSSVNGTEKMLSGIVLIPHEKEAPLPILLYCHGTLFNKEDAPSRWDSAVQLEAIPAMEGYITFIPDYLGYGSTRDEVPAYFDQEITTQTILDILPHGLNYLDNCGIAYRNDLYILGYSQGGHAAISVLKNMEEENATNLEVKAATSIAAPFKLKENVNHILEKDVFPATAYVSYLFASLNHYQWHRKPNEFFQGASLDFIEKQLAGTVTLSKMARNQSDTISHLMNKDFLEDYLGDGELLLKQSLERNSNFDFTPKSPLLVIHSRKDEVVPFSTSYNTWNQWIDRGADKEHIRFHALENENHSETAFEGILLGLDFFQNYK
ncbi:lipase family protein [Aureisphaera galaxeae]|uniref:alpha/beta hydrolase family protein n=1 Tax=Aureisphaera galaxeae TaxID=1538023 RepID=UPI00234FD0B7|nr:lipase family protein [Aureisphaera galaxeae]MDC8002492.1 lipase family protein [Aureisphaera galaxeae]